MTDIGKLDNRVRELRNSRGWTQTELSERLGVSRATVISIERRHAIPSLPIVYRIAEVFEMRIEQIFGYHLKGSRR